MHVTSATSPQDDLLVVANTRHGPGGHYHARVADSGPDHDHLADPADALAFLVDHAVRVPAEPPPPAVLARLHRLRELVRDLAGDIGADGRVHGLPPDAAFEDLLEAPRFRLTLDGTYRPDRGGWDGFVDSLVPPLLALRGQASRLRVCGNLRCRFAFVDRSRNRSRVWCETAICGNRVRVGRHRRRRG